VRVVQAALNRCIDQIPPLRVATVSGLCDAHTAYMIEVFQRRVLKLANPDGRVDPGGRTLTALLGTPKRPAEPTLSGSTLPEPAARVLREILRSAGVSRATVTSVSRTPADQARVMYNNCVSRGAAYNKEMYAAAGDKVVDVYVANKDKPRDAVIQLMLAKITEIGPERVSKHISNTHYTFDVDPKSIPASQHADFAAAVKSHARVSNLIAPPIDPAYHIEIPKALAPA
jgi:hypothetical protein